jgi:hypothetical protein
MKRIVVAIAACLALGSLAHTPAFAAHKGTAIIDLLPNARYPIEVASMGVAKLKAGVFEEPAAPGSAAKTRIKLGKEIALGDLNGDGAEDAAVTLVADPGGSGTFSYLAAVINRKGAAKPTGSLFLGDRIVVKSIAIRSGLITVTLLTRKEGAPMSEAPTVEVSPTFRVKNNLLKESK